MAIVPGATINGGASCTLQSIFGLSVYHGLFVQFTAYRFAMVYPFLLTAMCHES